MRQLLSIGGNPGKPQEEGEEGVLRRPNQHLLTQHTCRERLKPQAPRLPQASSECGCAHAEDPRKASSDPSPALAATA